MKEPNDSYRGAEDCILSGDSSLVALSQAMTFSEFLTLLFQAFENEMVRPCVLRNYEGFPNNNVGSDVDFLIRHDELPKVIHALKSLQGIRIVGYAERNYVAHLFVEGVTSDSGTRSLGVDFIWSLNWKGLEYLSTEAVLQTAVTRRSENLTFLVPSPVHEAIISLLSSLLIGGWLKEKYFPKVQQVFTDDAKLVRKALAFAFGMRTASQLIDAVISANRTAMLNSVRPLRRALAGRHFLHQPFWSGLNIAKYHWYELIVRCTPRTLETVRITGLSDCRKDQLLELLMPMLKYSAKALERRQFGPQRSITNDPSEMDSSSKATIEFFSSLLTVASRIAPWLVLEWAHQFEKRQNLTLRFDESHLYELLDCACIRLKMVPQWLTKLILALLPPYLLWIAFFDEETSYCAEKYVLGSVGIQGKREDGQDSQRAKGNHLNLESNRPLADLTENVYLAIIDTLVQRTKVRLHDRFKNGAAVF